MMLTDDWYPALARPNVELVTEGIEAITPDGVRTRTAASAPPTCSCSPRASRATSSSRRWRSPARGGRTLAEEWADVPRAYLGVTVPGFPNLFLLYGPNTNGGTGSVVSTIESSIAPRARGAARARPARRVDDRGPPRGRRRLRRVAARRRCAGTVWHSGCTNWYVDEHGNDPRSGRGRGSRTAAAPRRSTRTPTR